MSQKILFWSFREKLRKHTFTIQNKLFLSIPFLGSHLLIDTLTNIKGKLFLVNNKISIFIRVTTISWISGTNALSCMEFEVNRIWHLTYAISRMDLGILNFFCIDMEGGFQTNFTRITLLVLKKLLVWKRLAIHFRSGVMESVFPKHEEKQVVVAVD